MRWGSSRCKDGHGRLIGDVRISVTDRCNFRCQYCMPAEGLPWLERAEILRFEEVTQIVRVLAAMGVHDVRLTGGEPLVRRDFPQLAAMLAGVEGVQDLSVTTNGFLLARDAQALVAAGITRFNVSIDSLQRDRFYELTRRDALDRVLHGLDVLSGLSGGAPDQDQRGGHPRLHRAGGPPVRRAGPPDAVRGALHRVHAARRRPGLESEQVLTGAEIRAAIEAVHPLEPLPRDKHATARVYRFADGQGRIGFINPVSEPFCGDCNRIRLTADGRLRTCLFSLNETDLRSPIRDGADDAELARIIRDAVWRKELKHHVGEPGFVQPARTMSAIGG